MTPLVKRFYKLVPDAVRSTWFDVGEIPHGSTTLVNPEKITHLPYPDITLVGLDKGTPFCLYALSQNPASSPSQDLPYCQTSRHSLCSPSLLISMIPPPHSRSGAKTNNPWTNAHAPWSLPFNTSWKTLIKAHGPRTAQNPSIPSPTPAKSLPVNPQPPRGAPSPSNLQQNLTLHPPSTTDHMPRPAPIPGAVTGARYAQAKKYGSETAKSVTPHWDASITITAFNPPQPHKD